MDAAIVEFDALADAVGAAAEHDDLAAVAGLGLALGARGTRGAGCAFVGRIHVGRTGLELGGAGVDALEHRAYVQGNPPGRHTGFVAAGQAGQAGV